MEQLRLLILLPSLERIQSIAGLPHPLPPPFPPPIATFRHVTFVPVKRCLCVPINTPGWRGTLQGTTLKPLPKTQVYKLFETEINNLLEHRDDFQSGDGVYVVVSTLISQYYGPGSIPESGHTRWLRLLLVLVLDLWVSLQNLPFCYPAKANILIFFT